MQEVNNTSALEEQLYYIGECKKFLEKKTKEIGRPLYACVHTFGCQMNARDSEKLLGVLKEIGYLETEDEDKSDFVIYNTCTVRENANLKVYGRLGHLKNVKRKNPHMLIAMCGCMMQEPDVVEKIRDSYKFVDIVLVHLIYMQWQSLYITELHQEARLLIYGKRQRILLRSFLQKESSHSNQVLILCTAVIISVLTVLCLMYEEER